MRRIIRTNVRKLVVTTLMTGAALAAVSAVPAGAQSTPSVSPVLECVFDAGGGSYVALWGYNNRGDAAVEVPVGATNQFTPSPADRGQPTKFEVGRVVGAFTTKFNGDNLVWSLTGRTATANKGSAACKEPPVPVGSDSPQAVVIIGAVAAVIVLGGGLIAWLTKRRRGTATV
jgi:hypothetical protein